MHKILLSVVVPVYNEAQTIDTILKKIFSVDISKEIIVVDDGSMDGTHEKLSQWEGKENIKIVHHEKNQGKGAAIRTALQHINGDIIVIQDADLEYNPADYSKLLEPIITQKADVVYGSRFLNKNSKGFYFWHWVGNKFLTMLTNFLYNIRITDMETCYKMFRAELAARLNLKSNDFTIEPELTAKFVKLGRNIFEVPITYTRRGYSRGKKIGWKDGFKAIGALFWFRLFD